MVEHDIYVGLDVGNSRGCWFVAEGKFIIFLVNFWVAIVLHDVLCLVFGTVCAPNKIHETLLYFVLKFVLQVKALRAIPSFNIIRPV